MTVLLLRRQIITKRILDERLGLATRQPTIELVHSPSDSRTINHVELRCGLSRSWTGPAGRYQSAFRWFQVIAISKSVTHKASNEHTDEILILASAVKEAIAKLRSLCPQVPDLPPFEIV